MVRSLNYSAVSAADDKPFSGARRVMIGDVVRIGRAI
jgi:hypothetical protein